MLSCYECKDMAKYGETQEPLSIFRLNKSIRKLKSAVEKASLQYLKVGILLHFFCKISLPHPPPPQKLVPLGEF